MPSIMFPAQHWVRVFIHPVARKSKMSSSFLLMGAAVHPGELLQDAKLDWGGEQRAKPWTKTEIPELGNHLCCQLPYCHLMSDL